MSHTLIAAATFASALSMGCSYLGTARDFDPAELGRDPGWITAGDVPLIRQQSAKDCGAAALAMTLAYWKREGSADEIVRVCQPSADRGILAGALRDFALRKGVQAFLIEGTMADFERELLKRRPVIVGLAKPHLSGATAHYEVVVAIHPVEKSIVTLDPARGWRRNTFEGFNAEWEPTRRLTLVVIGKTSGTAGSD